MNPQEQPNSPTTDNGFGTAPAGNVPTPSPVSSSDQTPSEADTAALQAIETLESEDLGAAKDTTSVPTTPVSAPVSSEPTAAPVASGPTSTDQTVATPSASPAEASAAGVNGAVGAQTVANSQTVSSQPVVAVPEKKKTSKLVVILLVVALVLVIAATVYFVTQSM